MVWGGRGKEPMSEVKSKGCPLCSFTPCKREGCAFFILPIKNNNVFAGCAIPLIAKQLHSVKTKLAVNTDTTEAINK
jgi:hypothetical protein